jgi:tRNA threonylcarbamoyladenosine biosynthesis protein TsaB
MATLAQLLVQHRRILVLDAASAGTQAGLLQPGASGVWHRREEEAGNGIFAGTAAVLLKAGVSLEEIDAFVFCEGPGSMLGSRTIAMALRTWQVLHPRPAYAYQSLAVAGRHEWTRRPRAFAVLADARRDTWHVQTVAVDGTLAPLQRTAAGELPAGELVTPENFRAWAQPPRPAAACRYDLAMIFPTLGDGDFFRPAGAPDAFQHEAPAYRKWSAQVHRAAPAPCQ